MPPQTPRFLNLTTIEREVLGATLDAAEAGRRVTLSTLTTDLAPQNISYDEISRAAYTLQRLDLLEQVRPAVKPLRRAYEVTGRLKVAEPDAPADAAPAPEPAAAPPAPSAPKPTPEWARTPGESWQGLLTRLLEAHPDGLSAREAYELVRHDVSSTLSTMAARGHARVEVVSTNPPRRKYFAVTKASPAAAAPSVTTPQPEAAKLAPPTTWPPTDATATAAPDVDPSAPHSDDDRPVVAPAPDASPDVGPAEEAAPGEGGAPRLVEGEGEGVTIIEVQWVGTAEEFEAFKRRTDLSDGAVAPAVAPAKAAQPCSATFCKLSADHPGPHTDRDGNQWETMAEIVEMVEAVADAIAAESPSQRLAVALRRVVSAGYTVEPDESEPCGAIIGTPDDEVISVEIRGIEGRHILWISPQGGMGVSFDDALLAAIRATCALTAPDDAPFIPEYAAEPAEVEDWRARLAAAMTRARDANQMLIDVLPHDQVLEQARHIGLAMADGAAEMLCPTTLAKLAADRLRGMAEDREILAAKDERIAELVELRRIDEQHRHGLQQRIEELDKEVREVRADLEQSVANMLAAELGRTPGAKLGDLLAKVRDLVEDLDKADKATDEGVAACEQSFADDLADALGVVIEETDPSVAVAKLLDEVRRRKPVQKLLADARRKLTERHHFDMHTLVAAARVLNGAS